MIHTDEETKVLSRLQDPKGFPARDYTSCIIGAVRGPNLTRNFNATEELLRIGICFCSKPHEPSFFLTKREAVPGSITAHEASKQAHRMWFKTKEQSIYVPYKNGQITQARGQGTSATKTPQTRQVVLKGGPYISDYFPRVLVLVHDEACLRRQAFFANTKVFTTPLN